MPCDSGEGRGGKERHGGGVSLVVCHLLWRLQGHCGTEREDSNWQPTSPDTAADRGRTRPERDISHGGNATFKTRMERLACVDPLGWE